MLLVWTSLKICRFDKVLTLHQTKKFLDGSNKIAFADKKNKHTCTPIFFKFVNAKVENIVQKERNPVNQDFLFPYCFQNLSRVSYNLKLYSKGLNSHEQRFFTTVKKEKMLGTSFFPLFLQFFLPFQIEYSEFDQIKFILLSAK